MKRIVIVDDSPTSRQILRRIIESDPELEVVGEATNGRDGVAMVEKHRPDLVTMDIQMPEMNGFEATKEIMIQRPTPILIVSASTRVNDVANGMKALTAGALALTRKPEGPGSDRFEAARRDLVKMVKAMSEVKVVRHYRRTVQKESSASPATPPPPQKREVRQIKAVAIAASTGGPPALAKLLGDLPAGFPVPILIVQHIAAGFVSGFARWLDTVTPLNVKLGVDGTEAEAGAVHVAPEDTHLGVTRGGRLKICDDGPIGGFRPAASYLFESFADAYRENSINIILTGMGRDGVEGLRVVRKNGGVVVAQDEATSIIFGMPKAAIAEGLADEVLPLEKIAPRLIQLVGK